MIGDHPPGEAALVSCAALTGALLPVALVWWAIPHVPLIIFALPVVAVSGPALGVYLAASRVADRQTGRRAALMCAAVVVPVWMFLLWNRYTLAAGLLATGFLSWRVVVRNDGT